MTENEAIKGLETLRYQCKHNGECGTCNICCSAIPLAIQALEEIQQYRAIGTVEELEVLKEKNEEVEIPEPQGNEIVAGIMLPKVKGKAVVSLSDLHDILMDFGGINIRDKVFEQIYDRGVIIGLRDVIEKWEERRKNAEHEDCALSCEEIRNKAIDEFAETLKEKYEEHNFGLCLRQNDYYSYSNSCMLFENYIDKIAEQLKAGGKNAID